MNNELRQHLTNTLGLTRESVRNEASEIIRETIERRFNNDWMSQLEDRIVERVIQSTGAWHNRDAIIKTAIQRATERLSQEIVKELVGSLDVVVTIKGDSPAPEVK